MAELILIGGGSCSGKTTIASALCRVLGDDALQISTDNFYKGFDPERKCCRKGFNFDRPDAVDFELLLEVMQKLKAGESAAIPDYDFASHTRTDKIIEVYPKDYIILEGIFALYSRELLMMATKSIYVDCGVDIAIRRRIERDSVSRSRDVCDVVEQFLDTVLPMYYEYVEPTRELADLIVDGKEPIEGAVNKIMEILGKGGNLTKV